MGLVNASSTELLSNHGMALLYVARNPNARLRDVASGLGVTERCAFGLIDDLARSGVIERTRVGRANSYRVNGVAPMRHEVTGGRTVADLVGAFAVATGSPAAN